MTKSQQGFDYHGLDSYKRLALKAAIATGGYTIRNGFKEVAWSRGESAYVVRRGRQHFAIVVEGLGTKNLVADEMYKLTGKS